MEIPPQANRPSEQPASAPAIAGAEQQRIAFGQHLRKLRQDRGLTLTECAQLTGLAISTLSKAERGLMALTYDRLSQIATGLQIDLNALFLPEGESFVPGSVAVARRGEFQLQETPNYSYEILFSEMWGKAMTPMTGLVRARSRMDFKGLIRHDGQEFVFVISGQLVLYCEGREPIALGPGESAYFDSSMGHVYTTAGEEDARILVVCFGQNLPELR
ncbi:XRE family transcriptional regulator [Xinfangfangia sp. CPCC 101601]|uniref:XRE family transcriptional regulator n=1 Tax=Pseudogemmobacter lacusdianii TaxID=3069608 RepID=A0ABU0W1J4_9RHOB|nr:XRE family transcriptional regulator [Xinfangfangia sp. CPCC 101601]MDQ2067879.1 XRE family transcriptional regulator [Xinfangfangia sp. CPCC 101601]